MDTSVSDDNWGTRGTIVFLVMVTLITDMLFEQFLIFVLLCNGVNTNKEQ